MALTTDRTSSDVLAALWMAPFTLGMTMLETVASASQGWLQLLFAAEPEHQNGGHVDLHVPDPIEDTGEHDLFA